MKAATLEDILPVFWRIFGLGHYVRMGDGYVLRLQDGLTKVRPYFLSQLSKVGVNSLNLGPHPQYIHRGVYLHLQLLPGCSWDVVDRLRTSPR